MTDTLFDLPPTEVAQPLSPDRRRTRRQAEALAYGQHPLAPAIGGSLPLAPDAAPADDPSAPGRRCGNCWFRRALRHHNRSYPKCWFSTSNAGESTSSYDRVTHGPGTDVRAWWPGCRDHSYGDTTLSPDAARHVPEAVTEVIDTGATTSRSAGVASAQPRASAGRQDVMPSHVERHGDR